MEKNKSSKSYNVAIREDNLADTIEKLTKQLQGQDDKESIKSESTQAIESLNKDIRDSDGFSSTDAHTELTHNQVIAVTKLESLSKLDFMEGEDDEGEDPIETIIRVFQRKQISKNRKGRQESVQMFQQLDSRKEARGFWEKWFSPKE
jgi:hypothetical protein